ncbi:chorismate-binding protein, partial [Shewanella algae]|uniref:chorismate-binding protein n=1 Tax=Shewanella algae TaxID=38313 RepID=UPI00313C9B8C
AYPHTFVSLTCIPDVGLWIGASPEVLASQNDTELITYSLAGTKAIDDKSKWTQKEMDEQQIVTGFIRKKLEKIGAHEIK